MIKKTKNEFMTQFASTLHKRNIEDIADIIEEYEEHFAFKLEDGYSEEKIADKLGNPAMLAAQFSEADAPKQKNGSKIFAVAGLCFADIFAGLFFILLICFGIVMAASVSFAVLAVCFFANLNIGNLIPAVQYRCGAITGLSFASLTALTVVGCVYYVNFLRQLVRFRYNTLAFAHGEAILPSLSINPKFSAKTKRRMRSAALVSFALFAVFFVLSYIMCSLSAGSTDAEPIIKREISKLSALLFSGLM